MLYNFQPFKDEAKKIEEWLGKEFSQIHSGRASPAILDSVQVEAYGSRMALTHVASVSVEDPRTLRITPYDKSQLKDIERAVVGANLGLGTAVDDSGIRVSFPQLTSERREQLMKVVSGKLEEARIRVRTEREKVWDDIQKKEKEGILTEDEKFRFKDELQKLVEVANGRLEQISERKGKELMS